MDNDAKQHADYWTLDRLPPRPNKISLRLLVDRLTIEAYAFGGETFGAHYIHPKRGPQKLSIHAVGGTATIHSLEVRELKSAWQDASEQ